MKKYLMTPGPTTLPEDVLSIMAHPIIHHRTKEYQEINQRVNEGLQYIFSTQNPVFTLASSGTGAMETAVCNLLSSTDKAIAIIGGKFGERWAELCKAYKIEVNIFEVEWGIPIDMDRLREAVRATKPALLFATLCETSTGMLFDIKAISELCQEEGVMLVVDAISGLGADPMPTDEWGVDVVVSGSQKGLMCPPGLAFLSMSQKALEKASKSDLPKYYFSIPKAYKAYQKNDTAFTPAITLVRALSCAIERIKKEGLQNLIRRHSILAEATRLGIEAIGLELFPKNPSNAVTAVKVPEGIDGKKLVKLMKDGYGVNFAGGQGHLEGKIFRVAHLGYCDKFDVIVALSCIEMALSDLGYSFTKGRAIESAEKIIKQLACSIG
ncbi:MAG: alanine--glyoxylate aminotransferase family protein [bacterium]|nr:alanine--glyoxylate aminotransferase family protein [bacterium]